MGTTENLLFVLVLLFPLWGAGLVEYIAYKQDLKKARNYFKKGC